jgi:hypothetical protein
MFGDVSLFLDRLHTQIQDQDLIDQIYQLLKTIDIDHYQDDCDGKGNSLLGLICKNNDYHDIRIIEYLVKECSMDLTHLNNYGESILGLACAYATNNSVKVIEYLIKECEMDPNHLNRIGRSILGLACAINNSVEVINFLIEKCSMDPNHLDNNGRSILNYACGYNSIKVIEYLIKECSLNLNNLDYRGNSVLGLACAINKSVKVIEYLIKQCSLDPNHLNNYGSSVLDLACANNKSVKVIKYLMEIKEIEIKIYGLSTYKSKQLIALEWNDQIKYNQLIDQLIAKHGTNMIRGMINWINILTLTPSIRKKLSLSDPLELKFDKYKQLVDDLKMCVQIQEPGPGPDPDPDPDPLPDPDPDPQPDPDSFIIGPIFTGSFDQIHQSEDQSHQSEDQSQEIVFIHNLIPYYGNLRITLGALDLTRGMEDILCQYQEPIVLTSGLSVDLMDLWVRSIDTKMDIMEIRLEDLIPLLHHIDKYPTMRTNLTSIEYQVIRYMDKIMKLSQDLNLISSDLKDFAQSHAMKSLYLHLHNIKLAFNG